MPTASTSTSQVLSDALACGGYIPGYPNDQSCGLARMGDRPLAEEYRQRSPTHTAPRSRPTHSHVELVIRSLTGPALTSPLCVAVGQKILGHVAKIFPAYALRLIWKDAGSY